MAATYDVTTDVGQVRLRIGDTDIADAQFTDAEIEAFLDDGDTVMAAAGLALQAWAAALSRDDESISTGSWTADKGDVVAKMLSLSDRLLDQAGYSPEDAAYITQVKANLHNTSD